MKKLPDCAHCDLARSEMACLVPGGKGHEGCPSVGRGARAAAQEAAIADPSLLELARQASIQEGEGYDRSGPLPVAVKPRIVEICELARRMGYERIGLAHCIGLREEARMVADILEGWGFAVVSAVCKAGTVPKETLGIEDAQKIRPGTFESMCNPQNQARVLAEAGTQLNVVLGLCVGHDSLFFMSSKAPCTVLAAKDRVTGHNPLAAVYGSRGYWSRVRKG